MTVTVRKIRGKNDVDVRFNFIDELRASLEKKDLVEYLIEQTIPIAKKRKWHWFFEELEKRKNDRRATEENNGRVSC